MSQSNSESVKKYRAKMASDECARMEVILGARLITEARTLARQARWPVRKVVEQALIRYIREVRALNTRVN